MSSALKNVLVIAVIVLAVPLLSFVVLWLRAGKLAAVRNDSESSVEITEVISDGVYVERTETRVLASGESTWFYFFPKIQGPLTLRCVGGGKFSTITLSAHPKRFTYSKIVLDSCDSMVKLWDVEL